MTTSILDLKSSDRQQQDVRVKHKKNCLGEVYAQQHKLEQLLQLQELRAKHKQNSLGEVYAQ